MRADRLVATLLLLQARGQITARELAAELEVSEKTARRDLEALAMAGIPVYSQPGRGGGWSLLGGARTDLSGLTAAEARTLFLLVGPSATIAPEAKAALRKLVRALPETFRAEAEAAAAAVRIDPSEWGRRASHRPAALDVIQEATIAGLQIRLGYRDRDGNESERLVHPLGLVQKGSVWYLVANTDGGLRTFRVSRVRAVEVTDLPVERPPDFDLDRAWSEISERVQRLRTSQRATLRGPRDRLWLLTDEFGDDVGEPVDVGDGIVDVVIGTNSLEWLGERIAGLGTAFEVIDPPELRAYLARIGAELAARYADGTQGRSDAQPPPLP